MPSKYEWTERFPRGERVVFKDDAGDVIQRATVFTRGDEFLHFLLDNDDPLIERLKFSNDITIESSSTLKKVTGWLSIIDCNGGIQETSDDRKSEDSKRLIKFNPEKNETIDHVDSDNSRLLEKLSSWNELFHFRSLSATVIPIFLGIVYASWMEWPVSTMASVLALMGGVLLHSASNIHNEIADYHHALINGGGIESNPINLTKSSPFSLWLSALIMYGLACLTALPLLYWRGETMLAFGTVAFLIASYYSLFRQESRNSTILRDFLMFVLMGPLMSLAASVAASGHYDWKLGIVSIPVGLFVAVYLHEREIYNLPIDRRAGATTLAVTLGFNWSKFYYVLLVISGYVVITGLSLSGFIPEWTLLSYLSLPLAIWNLKLLQNIDSPFNPDMKRLRYSTVVLHSLFGLFYVAGFLAEIYLQ